MSKVISSNEIQSVHVADVFGDKVIMYKYNGYDFASEAENVSTWIEGITLFADATARTNVMIRGRNGRLLSYKNIPALRDTVASLKPFPVVGTTVGV